MSTSAAAGPSANASAPTTTLPAVYQATPGQPPLRWGLLGTGKIAEDFANGLLHQSCSSGDHPHASLRALSPCAGHVLQAIGSRSMETAQTFATKCGVLTPHGSYDSLVADPSVDVIYISTPDAFHAPHALLALRAGKPCLVEKPFASSAAEAEEIVAESARRGLFVMEGMWTRYVPAIDAALRMVTEGRIGRVMQLQSDFGIQFDIPAGAVNALGVYSLALSQMVFEADAHREKRERDSASSAAAAASSSTPVVPVPTQLHASGSLRDDGRGECEFGVQLRYGPRQHSSLTASLLATGANEAIITGTAGRIRLLGPMWHATNRMTVTDEAGAEQPVDFSEHELPLSDFKRPFNLGCSERLVHQAGEVARCIRAGLKESPRWTQAHTVQVMRMMEDVRRQVRER